MLNLVFKNGNDVKTDSRRVADAFGKEHSKVIRAIENLNCPSDFAKANFGLCYEINGLANGKPMKYYEITEQGAMLLIMGFTGNEAMSVKIAFIQAFTAMREQIASLNELFGLWSLRDAKSVEASECGRGLANWAKEKSRLDVMIKQREDALQLNLSLGNDVQAALGSE